MSKQLTFAIVGLGNRGMHAYGRYIHEHPDGLRIAAVADITPERVRGAMAAFNLKPGQCFNSAEELFAQEKIADVAIIASMDKHH